MQKVFFLGIDRVDRNSPSMLTEMRGTNVSQLPFIDLKIYYYETHLNEVFCREGQQLLTDKETRQIIDNFIRLNALSLGDVSFYQLTEEGEQTNELDYSVCNNFDFYELNEDGSQKYNTNLNDFKFIKGYRYLCTSKEAFGYLKEMVHLGPRGEGFYDLTDMEYLITFDGYIFKFGYLEFERMTQWLEKEAYDKMLPHLEHIQKTLKNAELNEFYSKRKNKTYYTLKFDKIVEQTQFEQFINAPDEELLKPYPTVKFHEIVRTNDRIDKCFDYFINKHKEAKSKGEVYWLGLDYETSGFPFDDPEFFHMGVGIADLNGVAAYFDMEWMQSIGGNFDYFLKKYQEFLEECAEDCHTYNVGFEMRCTYLLFNKLYFFQESASINKADGRVRKNFSLKYTAMLALHVPSWDDEFDDLHTQFEDLMWSGYDEEGNLIGTFNKEEVREDLPFIWTKDNYKESETWAYVKERYAEAIPEFERLLDMYWGYPFKCIPSSILGKYCCIDSFNTVWLRKKCEDTYPDKRVWSVFNNNLVYGALLNIHGFHLDLDYNAKLELLSAGWTTWCQLQCLKTIIKIELDSFGLTEDELNGPIAYLIQGYPILDSRALLGCFEDEHGQLGYDYDRFVNAFDEELARNLNDILLSNQEFFSSASRSKRVYNQMDEYLQKYFGAIWEDDVLVGFNYNGVEYKLKRKYDELTEYGAWLSNYVEVLNFLKQIDVDNLRWDYTHLGFNHYDKQTLINLIYHPEVKVGFVQASDTWYLDDIIEWCKGVFNMNSPKESVLMKCKIFNYYFDVYTKAAMFFGADDMAETFGVDKWDSPIEEYYHSKEILDQFLEDDLYKTYLKCRDFVETHKDKLEGTEYWKRYQIDHDPMTCLYRSSGDVFIECKGTDEYGQEIWDYIQFPTGRFAKNEDTGEEYEIFENAGELTGAIELLTSPKEGEMSGFVISQITDYMDYVDERDSLSEKFKTIDVTQKTMNGAALWGFSYLAQAKYRKVLTTYIRGQFEKYNYNVNKDDENLIATEKWHEEPTGFVKCYSPFAVCQKQSKRWGAATHTIPSKSEVKRVMCAPPGYLFSYNDISGAEVRAISYYAKDKFMLDAYSKGIDPYIMMSKVLSPGHEESWYKMERPTYKQLFLGSLYGMGIELLASKIGKTPEEAQIVYDQMFTLIPEIKAMIVQKGDYCIEHNGECDSVLGDKLYMDSGDTDRYARLGINQVIQSFAAIGLADGFEHMIYDSYKYNELKIRPVNVVHDSTQNYVETKRLFDLLPFFKKEITGYLYDKYGIDYEFDLEVGANYFDQCVIEDAGEGKVTLEGDFVSLARLMNKLTDDGLEYSLISIKKKGEELMTDPNRIPETFKPKIVTNLVKSFFGRMNGMASYEMDYSKYKVTLENRSGLKFRATENNNVWTIIQ